MERRFNMYIISKLWIDPMENRNAYGFIPIGVVTTKEEADRICGLEMILKSDYKWPLSYANEFKGEYVPRFTCEKVKDLTGMTIEELKRV
jgi:hypothetical protein